MLPQAPERSPTYDRPVGIPYDTNCTPPSERGAVVGLGDVGLPVALDFARHFPKSLGFDVDAAKVAELRRGFDGIGEITHEFMVTSTLTITDDPAGLPDALFVLVAAPTSIGGNRRPAHGSLCWASKLISRSLRTGSVVVNESTAYPGVTEDVCGPNLERASGLGRGHDFTPGSSPARINPGDHDHTLKRFVDFVAGEDAAALDPTPLPIGLEYWSL